MEIIVEELTRHGKVRERHKFTGTQVSIGRSYRNDLILSDPYVCPLHVRLLFDTEKDQWRVLDQSIQNGTFLVGSKRLSQPHLLNSGDEFDLGETRIRILLPDHEIATTRHLPTRRLLAEYLASSITAAALLICTLGLFAFAQYLDQDKEPRLQELVLKALMFLAVPFAWASLWGLIGRIAVHEARFAYHLSMGSLVVVSVFLLSILSGYLGFGLSSDALPVWLKMLGDTLLTLFFLLAALSMATQMSRLRRWLVASGIAWAFAGIALLNHVADSDPYESQALMSFTLKPPFARLQPAQTLEDFMVRSEEAFERLTLPAD